MARWYSANHLQQIARILEQVEAGRVKRVAVSIAPRHWKSSLTSEKFAAWYLGLHPNRSIILASHNVTLAQKFSRTVRDLIEYSSEYREIFPNSRLKTDSRNIDDWLVVGGNRSSFRTAGVNSGIAGYGAHLIIVDDLFGTYEQAASETYRSNAWDWYRGILRGRLEPNGAIVLVNSRWHESDTIGMVQQAEKEAGGEHYEFINIPVHDGTKYLWEDRWSPQEYENLRAAVGEAVWGTQYMGVPEKQEGNLIKRKWFEFVPQLPEGTRPDIRAYDMAIKLKETQKLDPDYTAEVSGTFHNQILYLSDPALYRSEAPEIMLNIVAYKYDHPWVRIAMPKSLHETTTAQFLIRKGIAVTQYPERGDLVARSWGFIQLASQGRIKLVGTPSQWEPFLAQWSAFPNGSHDDAVAVTAGLNYAVGIDQAFEDTWSQKPNGLLFHTAMNRSLYH